MPVISSEIYKTYFNVVWLAQFIASHFDNSYSIVYVDGLTMILRQLCLLYDNSYEIYVDQHHNILFCLGLENKIISLQQRLTDANAENKALKQQVIYQLKIKYAFNIIYRVSQKWKNLKDFWEILDNFF